MRITVGTTRPFHLFQLARELARKRAQTLLYSYIPSVLAARYNFGAADHVSLFNRHPILSSLALQKKSTSLQQFATEKLFSLVDEYISDNLKACDVYVGLSGMAIKSLRAARSAGALAICDRGSSHVLHQATVMTSLANATQLSKSYIERELAGYDNADFIAVPSLFAAETFREHGFPPSKLIINPYGVDLTRFCLGERARARKSKLLFVGNWCLRKGCDLLTELIIKAPEYSLTHVGTIGDAPFPKSSRFVSLGPVANDKLPPIYNSHSVFVFPSREDGFGLVILEALACGLPVVASVNCGAKDAQLRLRQCDRWAVSITENTVQKIIAGIRDVERGVALNGPLRVDKSNFGWSTYGEEYYKRIVFELNGGRV